MSDINNEEMRMRSGSVDINCKLTSFIYQLLRDHLSAGVVESIVKYSLEPDVQYTNGWLAKYAEDIAKRLK